MSINNGSARMPKFLTLLKDRYGKFAERHPQFVKWQKRKAIYACVAVVVVPFALPHLVIPSYDMEISQEHTEVAGKFLHGIKWEDREKWKRPILGDRKTYWWFVDSKEDTETYADKVGTPIPRRCLYAYVVEAFTDDDQMRIPPSPYFWHTKIVRWPLIATECRVGDKSHYEYFPR